MYSKKPSYRYSIYCMMTDLPASLYTILSVPIMYMNIRGIARWACRTYCTGYVEMTPSQRVQRGTCRLMATVLAEVCVPYKPSFVVRCSGNGSRISLRIGKLGMCKSDCKTASLCCMLYAMEITQGLLTLVQNRGGWRYSTLQYDYCLC